MSAITIEEELVHYEVLGRGKPIILIHGWLGSWRYWVPAMQQLSTKYRCYAIDLWGFGDSGKDPARYTIEKQTDLLGNFIERMGIPKVVLVGHSLGAAVAAQYASSPLTAAKVHRMLLVAPPLLEAAPDTIKIKALTTNIDSQEMKPVKPAELPPPLSDTQAQMPIPTPEQLAKMAAAGMTPLPSNTTNTPEAIQSETPEAKQNETPAQETIQPGSALKAIFTDQTIEDMLIKATDPESSDYEKLKAEAIKADDKAIHASVEAFTNINTFRDLMTTTAPVCALLGENDSFLPRPTDELLNQLDERQDLKLLVMANARHFPMLDDKAQFVRLLKDFLEAPEISTLEMKEEWRRRKR